MSTPDPNMRISNAEREAIIGRLHAATEEGRLDLDEFADRSREVYEAKTYGEVDRLLTDLPDRAGQVVVPGAEGAADRADPAPSEVTLNPIASSVQRKGEWLVPRRIGVDAKASSVKLDFRHAVIGTREVDLEADLKASSVEIILPKGAYAVDEVEVIASSITNKCEYQGVEGLRLNVGGKAKASSIKIRYEHRFLWWRW
ncbi:DUF1707 SHOCT-like domain-containing protein [Glycomyces xiaoerkulensis]|uniref:DUF1707 SHOCT-like domain-containing protein n=1 Tax=Glycomyces xiaoerkulensis TaxID=2038139 RepID=UPI000C257371|nr:DUF1707 domain-containing protein [Glycomyces xiaoerkulensis]